MIDLARVGNNALTLIILAVFFYLVYAEMKSSKIRDKIKGLFRRGEI